MSVNHSFSHCQLASRAVSQSFSQPASQPASSEVILWVSPSVSEPIKLFLATVKVTPRYHLVITLLLIIKCLDVKALFSTYISDTIYFSLLCQVTNILFNCFFLRLDYSGIAIFIMGSFIPPLYYGFYCSRVLKIFYICLICSLGIICIIVSLWDKFNAPEYRLLRAGKALRFS